MSDRRRDAFQRCCAIEAAAIPVASAKPFFLWKQSMFPYFTHRPAGTTYGRNSESIATQTERVAMRMVVAHATEKFSGDAEEKLTIWMEAIDAAFPDGSFLNSVTFPNGSSEILTDYPVVPTYLYPTGIALLDNGGLQSFDDAGVAQIGVEWVLEVPMFRRQ
jgi:hypothetical protein